MENLSIIGQFHLCKRGEAKLLAHSVVMTIHENDLFFLSPLDCSMCILNKSSDYEEVTITVNCSKPVIDMIHVLSQVIMQNVFFNTFFVHISPSMVCEYESSFKELNRLSVKSEDDNENELREHQYNLLSSLVYNKYVTIIRKSSALETDHAFSSSALEFLLMAIYHSSKSNKLAYYAENMHISVNRLIAIVRSEFKISPSVLLTNLLLDKLVALLVYNEEADVATRLGFSSCRTMNQFVKKHKGLTAREYLNKILSSAL